VALEISGSRRSSIRFHYTNGAPQKRKSRRIAGLLSLLNLLRELGRVGYAVGFLKKLKIWCVLLQWDSDAEQPLFPEPKFIINGYCFCTWNAKRNRRSFSMSCRLRGCRVAQFLPYRQERCTQTPQE
jgi:hypothetical protein